MLAVVLERLSRARIWRTIATYSRVRDKRLAVGHAVPALDDLRARGAEAEQKRPPESWSSVIAVIAVIAGVRAGICMIAVPTPIRSVVAAIQVARDRVRAAGSAVQTEWKPSRSASCAYATPPTPPGRRSRAEGQLHRQPIYCARARDDAEVWGRGAGAIRSAP